MPVGDSLRRNREPSTDARATARPWSVPPGVQDGKSRLHWAASARVILVASVAMWVGVALVAWLLLD